MGNAESFAELEIDRNCVIDASAYGMGRCAGNLCLELIIPYMNNHFSKNYEIGPLLYVIDKYLMPIYKKQSWGYSVPYYISAIHRCHPNYAKYFVEKGISSAEIINNLIESIPNEYRSDYSKDKAEEYYLKLKEEK